MSILLKTSCLDMSHLIRYFGIVECFILKQTRTCESTTDILSLCIIMSAPFNVNEKCAVYFMFKEQDFVYFDYFRIN